jgi:hypothetical protein
MSGDHAKREIKTGDKFASSGRTLSRESDNKNKEQSSSSIKSHRRGDKKKKMKKVVYYETDSSSPSTSSSESSPLLSVMSARSIIRCPYAIPVFQSVLHYFPFPTANHHILMVKIIVCGVIK